jgi:hypothetical protein
MVTLVEQMLQLHKRLAEAVLPQDKTMLQRQIEATDQQIDRLVYELCGLTEDEIGIVEGGGAWSLYLTRFPSIVCRSADCTMTPP